jgi:hypothetical protein
MTVVALSSPDGALSIMRLENGGLSVPAVVKLLSGKVDCECEFVVSWKIRV